MPSKEREPTYAELGAILLLVIGAGGAFTSANGNWTVWDALPRLVGIVVSLFLVFVGAVLLVVPEAKRPGAIEAVIRALVEGLKITLRTIESLARMILGQISKWEEGRKEKRGKDREPTNDYSRRRRF